MRGAEQGLACDQIGRGGDNAGDGFFDAQSQGLEPGDLRDDEAPHGGIGDALELIAELDRLGNGKIAQTDMLGQLHGLRIMNIRGEIDVQRSKASCDDGGIERVGLGDLPLGAGEAAHACRIEQIGASPS